MIIGRPGFCGLLCMAFAACHVPALAQDDPEVHGATEFRLDRVRVLPGQMGRDEIPIAPAGGDGGSFIPVTVLHGSRPGPVLSLIAGVHGSEYAPILAMQRLPGLLDPAELSGTLIVVHAANMPAFRGRTVYFGPDDGKNLNRSFPGTPNGTLTERIAHWLVQEVILSSDYLIDIHSGDANERLRPAYSAYYAEAGGEEVIAESRRLAISFGLDTIVQFAGDYPSVNEAIYTSAQAVARGIPAMDVESGELGLTDDSYVDPIIKGTLNVLRELAMLPGEPEVPANPLFISERARVYSEHDGVWRPDPLAQAGSYVNEGSRLGMITDYFGRELTTITAPASGVLLILFGTPPVNVGDNLVVVGKVPGIL